VIYISSGGSGYGNQKGVTTEDALPVPISAYGVSKYAIENYIKLFHHNEGLQFDVLRFSNVYGVGQHSNNPQGLTGALARSFIAREAFQIWGDGTAKKDYIYIDDAAEALAKVVVTTKEGSEVTTASVAVNAGGVDVKASGDILGKAVSEVGHRMCCVW